MIRNLQKSEFSTPDHTAVIRGCDFSEYAEGEVWMEQCGMWKVCATHAPMALTIDVYFSDSGIELKYDEMETGMYIWANNFNT